MSAWNSTNLEDTSSTHKTIYSKDVKYILTVWHVSKKSNFKDEQNFLNKFHTVATKRGITSFYIW